MKYEHIVGEVFHKPWAILPEKLAVISEIVRGRAIGDRKFSEEEIRARLGAASISAGSREFSSGGGSNSLGTVAVLSIYGVLTKRVNLMTNYSGGTSIEKLTTQFRAALADPNVKVILFDVDSPGGTVEGVPELADEIYNSRGRKRIISASNSTAASAAYWIACAAGEMVVTPSGAVGSIGVFTAHEDLSKAFDQQGVKITFISAGKYKTDGNEAEPLSESARSDMQSKVDAFYGMFVKSVARSRGTSQATVRSGFGQGRMVLAADALKERMVDRVETIDETFARLGAPTRGNQRMAAATSPALLSAGDPEDQDDAKNSIELRRRQLESIDRRSALLDAKYGPL